MFLHAIKGLDLDAMGVTYADIFWILAYLPYMASLTILVLGYRASGFPMGRLRRHIALASAGCAVALALFFLVLLPIARDPGTDILSKIAYLYYPIADFVLLAPAVVLVAITAGFGKGILAVPWKLIAVAFLLWAGADQVYSVLSWNGLYGDGNPIDAAWNLAYLLIGAAGLWQRSILGST
jgi:hypothetical protein